MNRNLSSTLSRPYRSVRLPIVPDGGLLAAGFLLVVLIALVDYEVGPYLSFSIFYLIPVAAGAWWGGCPHGILLGLAGSVAWHLVDCLDKPFFPPVAGLWNGVVRFGTLALAASLVSRLHAGVLRERRLARTDPLTGAANGRTFYEAVVVEAERARRAGRPVTLAYFDLDNFKQLNDRLGHAAGDGALRHVVETIQLHLRSSDLLARLGGDEFALLLPEVDGPGAEGLFTRLQQRLAPEMDWPGSSVTLSVGVATFLRPPGDVDRMIQRADALMYEAKRKGKGRVEYAVVPEALDGRRDEERSAERRATARVLCNRTARVHRKDEQEAQEAIATLCDLSAVGVGLHLKNAFPPNTVIVIEPLLPGGRSLLARVVRVVAAERGWMHGCVLSTRLEPDEFRGWLAT